MPEREKVIETLESCVANPLHRKGDKFVISFDVRFVNAIIELLKEQEAATEYVINEYQPTCKACGFRPFAGYIPSLEWMREREFKFCPHCGQKVKWE